MVVRKNERGFNPPRRIISEEEGQEGSHMRRRSEPKRSQPSDNSGTGSWKVVTHYSKLLILPRFCNLGNYRVIFF